MNILCSLQVYYPPQARGLASTAVLHFDEELATAWPYNLSSELIVCVWSAPFVEPDPLERVSGPSLAGSGRKSQNLNYMFVSWHDCY